MAKDMLDPDAPYGWEVGRAVCRACGAREVAVRPYAPVDTPMECAACGAMALVYEREDEP